MTQPAAESGSAGLAVTVDVLAAALVGLYADAETQLIGSLAQVARHGLHDSAGHAQLVLLGQMRRAAERVATQLRLRSGPLAQAVVREAATRGDAAAAAALRRVTEGHPSLASAYLGRPGHRIASANALALDLAGRLDATTAGILRFADDAYRAAVAEAATRQVLGREGLTPTGMQRLAWQELTRAGVTGYRDTAGRRWNLASYVEMASRTAVQRAYNASHEQRMTSVGIRYFTVSHDGRPCPLCRPWEGAILSAGLVGRVVEPAADTGKPVGFTVKGTLDQAHAAGFQHPNCKHVVLAYLPGVTRAGRTHGWTAVDQRRYDATQQLRHLERQVRSWKRAHAAALDDLDRQRAVRKIRGYQAQIRAHVDRHGLVRRRRREQLDLGNK